MDEPRWLTIARDLIGLKEIRGSQHAPEILALWRDAGVPFSDDETAWCAGFVGGCLVRGGAKSSGSAAARSYATWGVDCLTNGTSQIPLGAVVVYSRPPSEWSGHVGFAVGITEGRSIMTLGGNQKDSVNIAPLSVDRLIAARWPANFADDLGMLRAIPITTSNLPLSQGEA